MKKALSFVLALVMLMSVLSLTAFAEEGEIKLQFNNEGKFKILMVNDTQDVGRRVNPRMLNFLKQAIEQQNPDLVVFVGDQLSDMFIGVNAKEIEIALDNIAQICEDAKVPFAMTMGNHDHDHTNIVSEEGMYEILSKYSYNMNEMGYDYFTFNMLVYDSLTGLVPVLNVFMIDTNGNKGLNGNKSGYDGVTKEAIEWYENKSDELLGVPSILFQHIPVKEIYSLFEECDYKDENAVYSQRDKKWYKLDAEKTVEGSVLGEAPCSENFDNITGQYQSWLEKDNIIGAWFGHDHVNTFEGVTDDGIRMGYNGGTGFRSYGNGDQRSVRVFEFDELDVKNYTTEIVTYKQVTGESINFVFADILTPAWLTRLMKVIYTLFGWAISK
jgi:hypothetical protein